MFTYPVSFFNSGVTSIKWLLGFNLNTTATVGPDAVDGYDGVNRYPRIWDATSGLVLPSGGIGGSTPLTEGERLSYSLNEGVVDDADEFSFDASSMTTDGTVVDNTIVFTANGQFAYKDFSFTVGETYRVTYQGKGAGSAKEYSAGSYSPVLSFPFAHVFTATNEDRPQVLSFNTPTLTSITIQKTSPLFLNYEPVRVAVTGDSIADTPIPYLTTNLPATTFDESLSGQTFAWVASTGMPNAIATGAPNLLIHCGINDVSTGRSWNDVETDLDTIKALIVGGQKLFIDEILPWTSGPDVKADEIRTWNVNLATWCASNDAVLISSHDALGVVRGSTGELDDLLDSFDSDGLHLTIYGDDRLGKLWADAIGSHYGTLEGISTNVDLHPTKQLTENGVTSTVYIVYQPWTNGATVAAGGVLTDFDGVQCKYYSSILGGTTSGTGVADDIGVTDWIEQGNYNNIQKGANGDGWLPHVLSERVAVQQLFNSDAPATQTTGSLATGFYTLSVREGTGSIDLTAGTATIDGIGSASLGVPFTFEVTVAGTVTATEVGTVDKFQLESGSVPTTFILSAGGTVQRNETDFQVSSNPLPVNNFMMRGRAVSSSGPPDSGNTTIFQARLDASNLFQLIINTNNLLVAQTVAGSTKFSFFSKTIALDEVFSYGISKTSAGGLKLAIDGVDAGTVDVTATEDLLPATTLVLASDFSGGAETLQGGLTDNTINTDITDSDWYKDITWQQPE